MHDEGYARGRVRNFWINPTAAPRAVLRRCLVQ